jgi:hypothetical protein
MKIYIHISVYIINKYKSIREDVSVILKVINFTSPSTVVTMNVWIWFASCSLVIWTFPSISWKKHHKKLNYSYFLFGSLLHFFFQTNLLLFLIINFYLMNVTSWTLMSLTNPTVFPFNPFLTEGTAYTSSMDSTTWRSPGWYHWHSFFANLAALSLSNLDKEYMKN